jgi:hypothetical protein
LDIEKRKMKWKTVCVRNWGMFEGKGDVTKYENFGGREGWRGRGIKIEWELEGRLGWKSGGESGKEVVGMWADLGRIGKRQIFDRDD